MCSGTLILVPVDATRRAHRPTNLAFFHLDVKRLEVELVDQLANERTENNDHDAQ